MTVRQLQETPPWEWPDGAAGVIKTALRDKAGPKSDRMLAVELAGTNVVVDDEMAKILVSIVASREEDEALRARAAISLGPVLEEAVMEGVDEDPEEPLDETSTITKATFDEIDAALRRVFEDETEGKEVRRRALEGAVRGFQGWHADGVRKAYAIDDAEWKLTAIFGMGYVEGFDDEIVKALDSSDVMIRFEGVRAAGAQEVEKAWPHIKRILERERKDKDLLIAAIEASASINAEKAEPLLAEFADSDDEDIAEAAQDALGMAAAYDEEGAEEE